MSTGCIYKFRLRKGGGGYVGELVDNWGCIIALRGEVVEGDGVKVFVGTGTLTGEMRNHEGHMVANSAAKREQPSTQGQERSCQRR